MYERFTDGSRRALTEAKNVASERGDSFITPSHLILGLTLSSAEAATLLERAGVTFAGVSASLPPLPVDSANVKSEAIPFDDDAKEVLQEAIRLATPAHGPEPITTRHLLAGALRADTSGSAQATVARCGGSVEQLLLWTSP